MRKRYRLLIFVVVLIVCVIVGVRHIQAELAMGSVMPVDKNLISANTDFAFRLLNNIASKHPGSNILISPSSLSMSLAMAYNGSEGDTHKTMSLALGLDKMSLQDINESNANLLANLNNPGAGVNISMANGLWTGKIFPIVPGFIDMSRKYYDAKVSSLDFADPSAKSSIDAWVSKKTHGKIDRIAEGLDGLSVLCLVNAIYFKGTWTSCFDKDWTHNQPFMLEDGKVKNVPMMSQKGRFRFCEGKDFEAVALPYGSGRMSMYIFIPREGLSLREFLETLDADKLKSWLSTFGEFELQVTIPRWKLECETDLIKPCTDLGMGIAFDPDRSNFRGICKHSGGNNVYIEVIKQKTFIEVNEEGTEAAAATFTLFGARSASPEIRVNRPFFYAIRDDKTGAILFMGTVVDPEQSKSAL